jgi:hypothetical protein
MALIAPSPSSTPGRRDHVSKQHGRGDGPTPPGTGVTTATGSTRGRVDVADHAPVGRLIRADVDHDGSGPDVAGPDQVRSPGRRHGTPARRVTSSRSRVAVWQIVTVACSASSSRATGLPTTVEAAHYDCLGSLDVVPEWCSSSIACAVAGAKPEGR